MNVTIWLIWVVANVIGGAVSGALIDSFGLLGLAFFGVPIGVAQYLVLKSYWPVRWTWVVATTIGALVAWPLTVPAGLLGAVLVLVLKFYAPDLMLRVAFFFAGGAAGAAVGLAQRTRAVFPPHDDPGWVRASILAVFAAGGVAGFDLVARALVVDNLSLITIKDPVFHVSNYASVAGAVFGAIYGAITGIALARLRRRAVAEAR